MKYIRSLFIQDSRYFNHIEGLRAIACLCVIWYHFAYFLQLILTPDDYLQLLKNPFLSVGLSNTVCLDLFFLISGYVISFTLMREYSKNGSICWREFFIKRFARVYPCYIFVLIFCVPFSFHSAKYMWANLLLINNQMPMVKQHLPWTWSLAVEFQFYFVIAAVLAFYKNWERSKLLLSICAFLILLPTALAVYISLSTQHYYLDMSYYTLGNINNYWYFDTIFDKFSFYLSAIVMGVIVGYLTVFHRENITLYIEKKSRVLVNLVALLFLTLIGLTIMIDPLWSILHQQQNWQSSVIWSVGLKTIFSVSIGAMLILSFNQNIFIVKCWTVVLGARIWRPFGQLAFTAFLVHPAVLLVLIRYFNAMYPSQISHHLIYVSCLALAWIYGIAALLYLKIESPVMNYVKSTQRHIFVKPLIVDAEVSERREG